MLDARRVEEKKLQEGIAPASGSRAFDDLTDLENDEFIVSRHFLHAVNELMTLHCSIYTSCDGIL